MTAGEKKMAALPKMEMSHIGIWVTDFERMKNFYMRMFGMVVSDEGLLHGAAYAFLTRDPRDHHQIVVAQGRAPGTETTINQISFRVADLSDLKRVHQTVTTDGDVQKFLITDHGNAWSVYFWDPEGNRLEAFMDTPWYINQPHRYDLDLTLPDEEIYSRSEAHAKADPTYRPIEDWRAMIAKELVPAE